MDINNTFDIQATISTDPTLKYEPISLLTKLFNKFFLLPLFGLIPKRAGILLFTRSSSSAQEVFYNAKSSRALEVLYNFNGKFNLTGSYLDDIFSYFWHHNILNAKAVRNRFKLVKHQIYLSILEIYAKKRGVIDLFSLASGSARVDIEVMASLKSQGINVQAKFLDLNNDALNLSKKIAVEYNVDDSITLCNDKVSNFLSYCDNWRPDIIEMVGFLDYLSQEKAIALSSKIYQILPEGGIFLTCNIMPNPEKKFVSKILNWDMIYRNENELAEVLVKGGFKPENCRIIYEPYRIHGLIVGKK